jgi:hypothetical protein
VTVIALEVKAPPAKEWYVRYEVVGQRKEVGPLTEEEADYYVTYLSFEGGTRIGKIHAALRAPGWAPPPPPEKTAPAWTPAPGFHATLVDNGGWHYNNTPVYYDYVQPPLSALSAEEKAAKLAEQLEALKKQMEKVSNFGTSYGASADSGKYKYTVPKTKPTKITNPPPWKDPKWKDPKHATPPKIFMKKKGY